MTLDPLLAAAPAIKLHAFAAMAAFALGLVQLAAPKGTAPHRALGWVWVGLMVVVATSAFFIHEIRQLGPFSLIHLLAIYSLAMLPVGVLAARRHKVSAHKKTMIGLFLGALLVAGAFTFVPGRIMYRVVVGG
jgi:uncharacterized membrane protein